MRKFPVVSGALLAGALAVAACGGNNPAASTTSTLPAVPSFAIPSLAIPSFAIPSLPIGSFSIPSFNSNADPTLAARFPTQVGGQPVTRVETVNFLQFFQAFGTGDAYTTARIQAFVALLQSNGIDATQLSFGSGTTTVNGSSVQIVAYRTPGADANKLISLMPQLAALDQSGQAPRTVANANVGGKNVTTMTDATSGDVTYLYASGDVVWSVSASNPDEATAVFSALQ